jgi:hypothetical protein
MTGTGASVAFRLRFWDGLSDEGAAEVIARAFGALSGVSGGGGESEAADSDRVG